MSDAPGFDKDLNCTEFIFSSSGDPGDSGLNNTLIIFIGLVLTGIYAYILYTIWANRFKQVVYFKSPMMILIAGFSLYMDTLANLVICYLGNLNVEDKYDKAIALLSIFTTCSFHYSAYLAIVFRAMRVFRIMRLERLYLDQIQILREKTKAIVKSNDQRKESR